MPSDNIILAFLERGGWLAAILMLLAVWWMAGGYKLKLAADKEKHAAQIQSELEGKRELAAGMKAQADAQNHYTSLAERKFDESIALGHRTVSMLREMPGAIGEAMRLRDDMNQASKENK